MVASYVEIGHVVGNGSTFLLVDAGAGSGDTVGYYTQSTVAAWPAQADLVLERLSGDVPLGAAERLAAAIKTGHIRWVVIINRAEFQAQADLQPALAGYRSTTSGAITFYDLYTPIAKSQ